jgi:type I restriction enzyme R subunit
MSPTPEQTARQEIDRLLTAAGWSVQGLKEANLSAARGVALREYPLAAGHGVADYMLYADGKAIGLIEAKKVGATLSGVEAQSVRYAAGLPLNLPAWRRPLPFIYESTGQETHFTNGLYPEPRARHVFAFHRPETLADWVGVSAEAMPGVADAAMEAVPSTFIHRLRAMPKLVTEWGAHKLWPAQIDAVQNLEKSLAQNKPRALIQMATGSGKTFTAISFIYRLIKFGGARRVLFLVVSLPPRDERQRIVAEVDRRLSIVREGEAEVDANLRRSQALRQAVLSRHFQAHGRRGG